MPPTLLLLPVLLSAEPDPNEFFESKIRPVLVEHCYKCHSDRGKEPKGGLRVDSRAALLAGGDTGPAVVPNDLGKSKLIEAIHYTNADLLMPPQGKLPDHVIRDLETWVKLGAPWPGSDDANSVTKKADFDLARRKASHWCWKPLQTPRVPDVRDPNWPRDAIDRFILTKLEANNLTPASSTDPMTWLRRVTYAITGLPPTLAEIRAFQSDLSRGEAAYAAVVDRLLASTHYGERWARHWLDLVRYAESRGHEFDPEIPNAYQYRDYVVRALNADVNYQQFTLEHLAGDLLPNPRLDNHGSNESIIGPAFWHLGEEVHSPVDTRQDQADRLDNRIDVLTKTFLGLTVSCARCHDHKFDAISTKDYYALFGLLEGSAYRLVRFDGWKQNRDIAVSLAKLRQAMHQKLSSLAEPEAATPPPDAAWQSWLAKSEVILDFSTANPDDWRPDDVTYGLAPRPAGFWSWREVAGKPVPVCEPRAAAVFDRFWQDLRSAPHTTGNIHALGRVPRAGFSFRSRDFTLSKKTLYYLVRGSGLAYAAVNQHTVIAGPLHGRLVKPFTNAPDYRWVAHELGGYVGQKVHVELTADPTTDFAISMIVQSSEPPPPPLPEQPQPKIKATPQQLAELWNDLSDKLKNLKHRAVWESRLAPSLWEGSRVDERVFVRGNPRTLGPTVTPRWPEALVSPIQPERIRGSGRLQLAHQFVDPVQNPLFTRVIVNRVWHHLFGRGLVSSTDNFGVLGELPTHPELLDFLTGEFIRDAYSLKRLIRRLVLSSTYRVSSTPDEVALRVDPKNQLLHHFRIKRLEGEVIRDSLLSLSGRLNPKLGGPSVPIYLTPFLDGRGRPGSGPLDGDGRRSLYLAVRRNFLSPMMLTFDMPSPFSTVGRRQVSNVPTQALMLLNDPFIHDQIQFWAKRLLNEARPPAKILDELYWQCFTRAIRPEELRECEEFLAKRETDPKAWAELLHSLILTKEWIYLR